jgi:ribosomal-protein-alanine N-acetyltransferase
MELHCGSCVVRSWRPSDVESLVRNANDRAIWLALRDRFPHPYTRDDAEGWIRFATSQNSETGFAIDVGEAVGGIGVQLGTDVERCSAEVGRRAAAVDTSPSTQLWPTAAAGHGRADKVALARHNAGTQ